MKNANFRWNQKDVNGRFQKWNELGPFNANLSLEFNAFSVRLIETNVLNLHMDVTVPFRRLLCHFLNECLRQQSRINRTQDHGVYSSVLDDYESGRKKGVGLEHST